MALLASQQSMIETVLAHRDRAVRESERRAIIKMVRSSVDSPAWDELEPDVKVGIQAAFIGLAETLEGTL